MILLTIWPIISLLLLNFVSHQALRHQIPEGVLVCARINIYYCLCDWVVDPGCPVESGLWHIGHAVCQTEAGYLLILNQKHERDWSSLLSLTYLSIQSLSTALTSRHLASGHWPSKVVSSLCACTIPLVWICNIPTTVVEIEPGSTSLLSPVLTRFSILQWLVQLDVGHQGTSKQGF